MPNVESFKKLNKSFSLIPLNGKIPNAGNDWQEWCKKKRPFNPNEFKNKNAGVCCGPASNALVVDQDDIKGFEILCKANGFEVPETFTVKTGNGQHLFFQYPGDGKEYGCKSIKHPIFKKHTIFDIKGIGGQVVAAGSIHPDTGTSYTISKDLPIADSPQWLLDLIHGSQMNDDCLKSIPPCKVSEKLIRSMPVYDTTKELIINGVVSGERSEAGMKVLKALAGSGIHDNIIFYIFDHYPIGEKYRGKGSSKYKWLTDEIQRAKNHNGEAKARDFNANKPQVTPTGITAADLIVKEFKPIQWVIPGILPEGTTLFAAKPKHGKSIMALNIGIQKSLGGHAFGKIKLDAAPVVYLALEDTQRRLQGRIRKMLYGTRQPAPENLYLFTQWPKFGEGGGKELRDLIKSTPGISIIIVDTLKMIKATNAGTKSVYDVDYDSINALKQISDEYEIAILIIHHTRKSEAEDIFDTISGSLGLTGAADNILLLERISGQADATLHINGRDVEPQEIGLRFDADSLNWVKLGDMTEIKPTEEMQLLSNTLKNAEKAISPKDLADITGLSPQYVKNTIPKLIKQGTATKEGYGKYIYVKREYSDDTEYCGYSEYSEYSSRSGDNKGCENQEYAQQTKGEYPDKGQDNNKLSERVLSVPGVPEDKELFEKQTVAI